LSDPIRILHLEDDPNDAELIALQLESDHLVCRIENVASEKEFSRALDLNTVDLILADNTGPTFTGHTALALARKKYPQVPLIFVSGAGDSKDATRAIEAGASGYVLKDRLSDLAPCIRAALHLPL